MSDGNWLVAASYEITVFVHDRLQIKNKTKMHLSAVLDLNPVWEPGPLKMQLLAAAYCQKLNCHNNEKIHSCQMSLICANVLGIKMPSGL